MPNATIVFQFSMDCCFYVELFKLLFQLSQSKYLWFYYLILVKGMTHYLIASVDSALGSNSTPFQISTSPPSTVPYLATPFTKTSKPITEPFWSGRLQSVILVRVRVCSPLVYQSIVLLRYKIQSNLLVLSEKSIDYRFAILFYPSRDRERGPSNYSLLKQYDG